MTIKNTENYFNILLAHIWNLSQQFFLFYWLSSKTIMKDHFSWKINLCLKHDNNSYFMENTICFIVLIPVEISLEWRMFQSLFVFYFYTRYARMKCKLFDWMTRTFPILSQSLIMCNLYTFTLIVFMSNDKLFNCRKVMMIYYAGNLLY